MNKSKKYIERSPGNIIDLKMFVDDLKWLREEEWSTETWKPKAALIDNSGNKVLYIGQKYNPDDFDFVENGWSHDHCEMCIDRIDADNSIGYTEGSLWLCQECYNRFIVPKTVKEVLSSYKIIEK